MRGKKSSNFVLFLGFLALFISAPALATSPAGKELSYPVHFISVAPQIDGRLDEPLWQSLPEATGFYVLGGDVTTVKQTFFRVGWDKDSLYIGIRCEEPDIMEVRGVLGDGGALWNEDSVEIFLAPAFPDYFHFLVNTIGSRMGSVRMQGVHTIEFWEAQSYRGEDFWSTEIRIPFISLGLDRPPQDGETWKGNITRNITVFTSGGDRHTTWAPLISRFHEPDNFASFVFKEKELPVKEVEEERIAPPVVWKEVSPPVFSRSPGGTFARGKLTSATGPHVAPRLSPCRKKVLFNSFRGRIMGVWMVDYEGEKEERITDGEEASWSPDGKRIIFRREGRIIERVLASGEEKIMSPSGWRDCSFPGYSPDGKKIIFVAEQEGEKGIFLLELGGKEPRPLLQLFQEDVRCAPRWSPDGKRITFQDRGRIYVIDIEGTNRRRLTTAGGIQASPFWSLCGRGIIYCQAADPAGPWDLFLIGVDDRREPRRRMRKVDLRPDWPVEYFGEGLPPKLGAHLKLWEVGDSGLSNESFQERTGWRALSPDKVGNIINMREKSIAIENDWLILFISEEEVFIFCQEKGERIELLPRDERGREVPGIRTLRLLKNNSEEVVIETRHLRGPAWNPLSWLRPLRIAYRIPRTRPLVEIIPRENVKSLYLKANKRFLLLPDRLASDLIFDPARPSPARFPLPSAELSLGLLGEGDSLLMIVTPSDRQRVELLKGRPDTFTGLEISLGGESLFVALLSQEGIWQEEEPGEEPLVFSPETPFPGIYRLTLYGNRRHHTRIFSGGEKVALDEEWGEPQLAITYLYGRTERTPINILTPIDLMKEIFQRPLGEMLEAEGLLTYHLPGREPDPGPAKVPPGGEAPYPVGVPERLTAHRPAEDWVKHPHISFIIESLRDIHNRLYGKEYITWLSGVIERFIEGMNRRLDEYRNFAGQIDSLLEAIKRESPQRGEFIKEMERMKKELNDLQERGLQLKPKEEIIEHLKSIKRAEADHASFNILFNTIVERRELLREYKSLAMSLRDRAGMAVAEEPAIRELAEEIRKSTEVIGRRHFLEKKELLVIFWRWNGDQGRMSHVVTLLLEQGG